MKGKCVMSKLSKIAKKAVASGMYTPLDDIILHYPNGVTVNGIIKQAAKTKENAIAFTFVDTENENDAVNENDIEVEIDTENNIESDFEEYSFFYAESGDLKRIVSSWLDVMSFDEINAELKENPVTIKIEKIKTRNNRMYVKATIIDE